MDISSFTNPTMPIYASIANRTLIVSRLAGAIFKIESESRIGRITENKETEDYYGKPIFTTIGDADFVTGYFVDVKHSAAVTGINFEQWAKDQLIIKELVATTPFTSMDLLFTQESIRLAIILKQPLPKGSIKA